MLFSKWQEKDWGAYLQPQVNGCSGGACRVYGGAQDFPGDFREPQLPGEKRVGSCWTLSTQTYAQWPRGLAVRSQDPENERPSAAWLMAAFGRAGPEGRGGGQLLFRFVPPRENRTGVSMCPKVGGPSDTRKGKWDGAHQAQRHPDVIGGWKGCAWSGEWLLARATRTTAQPTASPRDKCEHREAHMCCALPGPPPAPGQPLPLGAAAASSPLKLPCGRQPPPGSFSPGCSVQGTQW